MKRILTIALSAVLLLGATVLLAQPAFHHRGHGGDHGEVLARTLDLTEDQKAAARTIHEEAEAKATPLMEQYRGQVEEVRALLDGGNANATQIGQKVIAAHATRQQVKAIHEEARTKFSALLNADQLEKLTKLHEKFEDMHDGPEGFGHPGPWF